MTIWTSYQIPSSLPQTFEILSAHSSSSAIVAGGTDLLLDLQQGRHVPVEVLVDITRIPELTALEIRADSLFIGAAIPLKQVAASSLVLEHAAALAESTGQIGGPQVRAVGTLGGNVGHALPAGDGAISLVALGATAEVASPQGLRRVSMLELYRGPGQSALAPGQEIITGFSIPLCRLGQASAFSRIMRPQGVALPIINMAAWMEVSARRMIALRVAVGPAGPVPHLVNGIEAALQGQTLTAGSMAAARQAIHQDVHFRSSPLRASADYRNHLADVLLERVLRTAYQRALAGDERRSE